MAELCCVCFNLERMFGHQDPYINITASCICPPCKGSIDSNALYPCGGRKMFVNEVLRWRNRFIADPTGDGTHDRILPVRLHSPFLISRCIYRDTTGFETLVAFATVCTVTFSLSATYRRIRKRSSDLNSSGIIPSPPMLSHCFCSGNNLFLIEKQTIGFITPPPVPSRQTAVPFAAPRQAFLLLIATASCNRMVRL